MAQLSKWKKDAIRREVIARKFNDRLSALDQKAEKIAVEFIKNKQKGIPFKACEGYISRTKSIYVVSGKYYNHHSDFSIKLAEGIPEPTKRSWYLTENDDKRFKKLLDERRKLGDEIENATVAIKAVLQSVNTDKQLLDTLPEIQPLMNDLFSGRENVALVATETVAAVKKLLV